MKIFLTGSKGFIGSHFVKFLAEMNADVFTDYNQLWSEEFDVIIHLSAVTNINKDFNPVMFKKNIVFTDKLFTESVFQKNARIIFASSCSANHLTNPYAYTKRYGEWLCDNRENAIAARLFNVYGPGNNKGIVWYLNSLSDGAHVDIRGPELVRDYIYVTDAIKDIVSLIDTKKYDGTGYVDVGTGVGTRTIDLFSIYSELSGKKFTLTSSIHGENEPVSMVAKRIGWSKYNNEKYSITEGLKLML